MNRTFVPSLCLACVKGSVAPGHLHSPYSSWARMKLVVVLHVLYKQHVFHRVFRCQRTQLLTVEKTAAALSETLCFCICGRISLICMMKQLQGTIMPRYTLISTQPPKCSLYIYICIGTSSYVRFFQLGKYFKVDHILTIHKICTRIFIYIYIILYYISCFISLQIDIDSLKQR